MTRTLRPIAIVLLAGGALLAGCSGPDGGVQGASPGGGAPVALPASVADAWSGRVVVVDFWATWCGPCRASSPNVQILHDTFAGDEGVLVVAVHADDNVEDPAAYLAEHGYTYALVARGEEVADAFGVHALPTFVVLDAEGREAYRSVGMMNERTRRAIEARVRELRG